MAIDPSLICFFKGEYTPLAEAKVGILTHGFSYGTGCFEGIRGYYNQEQQQLYLFRLDEHYVRLQQSARVLMINIPYTVAELNEITLECIRRSNLHTDVYIRPSAYKSSELIGVRLHNLDDDLYVAVQPFGNYIDIDRALRTGVSSWRRVDDNMIPARAKITGAYINSAFAKTEALLNGFDEAIMLTAEGHVSEGSAENLFMLRHGTLYTPPVTDNLLEGITRDTIITLVRDELGVPVVERSIDRTELYVADEILLCGTGAQIAPVGSVDHRLVGTGEGGELGRRLQKLYFEVVRGNVPKYAHWCSPVYGQAAAEHAEIPARPVERTNGQGNGHGPTAPVSHLHVKRK
ncbi:MAG TPA: branched-chain amino acid transaminase [Chloroflexia bacterium]|nr:branched-chain amino acid transaminase [Chloroflexia bacterium]